MVVYVLFVGIAAGAPVAWFLRHDTSWKRTLLAVLIGVISGILASFVIGTLVMGGRPAFVDPTVGTILGVFGAVIASRRQYGTPRTPNDLRN